MSVISQGSVRRVRLRVLRKYMETFVILFSATNKLALMKGQVYHFGNVEMEASQ